MNDPLDPVLFYEELDADQQMALRAALDADPALAEAFDRWRCLRADLRRRLDAEVPDRSLLVLYALADSDHAGALTPEEQAALAAARPALDRAFVLHPALDDVVARIRADYAAFEAVWEAHLPSAAATALAPDRAPRPRAAVRAFRPGVAWRVMVPAALVLFAMLLFFVGRPTADLVTVTTDAGGARLVTLADGSTVRLFDGARLSYTDPARHAFDRRVRLEGRAFFDVVHAGPRFTVETATARTTVLGTRFAVQAGERATEVILTSGRVAVAARRAPERPVMLAPGQMSRVEEGALPTEAVDVDLARSLDWAGLFVFRATRLSEIADLLSRHYGVVVTVDPALAAEPVYGEFSHADALPDILTTLAATLGGRLEPTAGGGYRLSAAP